MSNTLNLTGKSAAPLLGWPDPWKPPGMPSQTEGIEDELSNKAREIEIEAETKMMIFGLRVTLNAMSTQIGRQAQMIVPDSDNGNQDVQPVSLGKKLDLYL